MADWSHIPKARDQSLQGYVMGFVMVCGAIALFELTSAPSWVVILACSAYLFVMLIALGVVHQRHAQRFFSDQYSGIAMIARGEFDQARTLFHRWGEMARLPVISVHARHNLGWTLLRQGNLQEAIDVFTDNEVRNHKALEQFGLAPTSAVDLALCQAIGGNLQEAEKWMRVADERKGQRGTAAVHAMHPFARAVIDCRAGRVEEAAKLLDEKWAMCESLLTGGTLRPLRVVRAFAIAATGPRQAGVAESLLAMSKPAYPGEYDFLGVMWPEMASFLAAHQLTR